MAAAKKNARTRKPSATRRTSKLSKKAAVEAKSKKAPRPPARKVSGRDKKRAAAFGRVKVPIDALLDVVFQKDYQAREIFGFLKIQTIRELEQFAPDEIIGRLTGPLVQTVGRIRKTLALANRHLAKDEKFAKAFLAEIKKAP